MSRSLNYLTLCKLYTLEQIEEKVNLYMEQLEQGTVKLYDKDSQQGRQKVESQDLDKIESVLSVWLKALECKKGLSSGTNIVSCNFGRHH